MDGLQHADGAGAAHMGRVSDTAYTERDTDEMKSMVMGMIAVASVLAIVIGSILLSNVLHGIAGTMCDILDIPELFSLN
jgi:hypothetical protein